MKPKGISLVELTVVLGVIVLVGIIAVPLFNNYQQNTKLKNQARDLAINLRLAQQLAIAQQAAYQVKLLPETGKYEIVKAQTAEVIKSVSLESGVKINQISGLSGNQIQYTATGGVLETGEIALTNAQHQTSTVQIKPSGYVQISE